MADEARANFIAGAFVPAARGARSGGVGGAAEGWPQSTHEDVAGAARAGESARPDWGARAPGTRAEILFAMARELERDATLPARLAERFGLGADELAPHLTDLEAELRDHLARAPGATSGMAWCAPEWRELVRLPLFDLARELVGGRTAVLVSDARLPEVCAAFARAARGAGLPAGVLGVLHGPTRELVTLALERPAAEAGRTLVASGLVARMVELRRLCEQRGLPDPRLRALRCGAFEVDPAHDLAASAREVVERAAGRGTTLSGQLSGALGRVFCPARAFSRFSAELLVALEASAAWRAPASQIDETAVLRLRAACELALDEGATCIAGGESDAARLAPQPTIFTNVEPYMASARRQDPLPLLCLLRAP